MADKDTLPGSANIEMQDAHVEREIDMPHSNTTDTAGYLSIVPIEKLCFCDLSVRKKDWRAACQAFERMRNTHTEP